MSDHSQLDADLAQFEATEASEADQLAKTQATNAALVQQHAQDQATIAALQAQIDQLERPACLFGANVGGWEGETAQAAYTRISAAWPLQAVRVWGHNGADWAHVGIPAYLPPSLPLCIDLGSAASWTTAQWDALGQLGT
ncbi:MAG TPA: hypothetical protein VFH56_04830, partial [Acidimicrobiales bacterium]|nr:hypothetical protein [Acidimicrobiales bacterium]